MLLVFAITLFAAVLISCKARESILSVSVLFLLAGWIVSFGHFGVSEPNRNLLYQVSQLALFSVLFTDGMNTGGLKAIREGGECPDAHCSWACRSPLPGSRC